jgi:2,3-bisphosphoglycerate-dependent phosphoglycerate mutase
MTKIYFIRHAQPVHSHADDRTRPLTPEGRKDCEKLLDLFSGIPVDIVISSPYLRSMDTVKGIAEKNAAQIITDERLRERQAGAGNCQTAEMIRKRWADFNFCEQGGENLSCVQKRNIESVTDILTAYPDKNIVIGTHGTALCTILNYYNPSYNCDFFFRIIDFMPYVIRLNFDGPQLAETEELFSLYKEFKSSLRLYPTP